jgi:hypothetical protein
VPLAVGSVVVLNFANVLLLVYQITSTYTSVEDSIIVLFISILSAAFWAMVTIVFMTAESTQKQVCVCEYNDLPDYSR